MSLYNNQLINYLQLRYYLVVIICLYIYTGKIILTFNYLLLQDTFCKNMKIKNKSGFYVVMYIGVEPYPKYNTLVLGAVT